jgi:hypothetical protein
MRQHFTPLDTSIGITVSRWAKSPREHSEHEQDDPKVNVWYALTHKRVTGLFFCNENIIKRYSILDMFENYSLLQPNNNNLILQLAGAPVHFVHIICEASLQQDLMWLPTN